MDIVSKIPFFVYISFTSFFLECTIQLTFNIHSEHQLCVFFSMCHFSHLWFNPWHLAKMVPLFIRLAWSLVVMVGGECLETSMLQTQMLLKRTPLHPWEVNNYVMVSWPAKNATGICFVETSDVKSLRFVFDAFLVQVIKHAGLRCTRENNFTTPVVNIFI